MVSVTYSTDGTTMQTYSYSVSSLDIDSDALIEAAVYSKMQAAYNLAAKVTNNETLISSYTELQSLLTDLGTAGDALRNSLASSDKDSNVFLSRTAYLSTDDGVDAGNYLDVTVEAGTETGTHTLEIQQVAEAQKIASASQTSKSADLGYDGTFSLGLEGGYSVDIAVTSDMSLTELASAINAQSRTTGVKASIVQVDSANYTMVLTAQETGKDIQASVVSGDDVFYGLGITDTNGDFASVLNTAKDAIIVVDGLTITRDSNDIDDVLDGISFSLYDAQPGTTISIEVDENVSDIKSAITDFVDAYNAYRDFVITNQTVSSDGSVSEDAALFADYYLRSSSSSVADLISEAHGGYSLRDFGITLDLTNHLEVDDDTLNDALLNNLQGVKDYFAFQMTSSSEDVGIIRTPSSIGDMSFTLDITVDGSGKLSGASIGGDSSLFTVSGSRIIGAKGTIYEGMTLVYTGSTNQSVDIGVSQGMADTLYHAMDLCQCHIGVFGFGDEHPG